MQEVERAVSNGAKEIFLLGQNVNNYGRRFTKNEPKITFSQLLNKISKIEGVERIRFTSPHPLHMDDEFLEEFARNPKICKSMHMPLQSGSTAILSEMKRGYTKEWFLNRALKLRSLVPNVSISTDVIVGFPGESDEDFEDTMDVLKQVRFDQMFSFKYSPRPLTVASTMTNTVDEAVASARLTVLQDAHAKILDDITLCFQDKILEVLWEEVRPDGSLAGRSDNNFLVQAQGDSALIGSFSSVKITNPRRLVLYGQIV